MKRACAFLSATLIGLSLTYSSAQSSKNNVLFIVDFSGSMNEESGGGGEIKIDAAKKAFRETMAIISPTTNVGLMIFGQTRPGKYCDDITLLYGLGEKKAVELVHSIDQYKAQGWTPIADSLLRAKEIFANQKGANNSVILITDGREECKSKEDLCKAADELTALGVELRVHIVGLGHKEADRKEVECVVTNTGGRYVAATDAKTLKDAIEGLTEPPPPPPPAPPVIPPPQGCASPLLKHGSLRDSLRADSIKLTTTELAVPASFWDAPSQSNKWVSDAATLSIAIENCSGMTLNVGILQDSFSAGPCTTLSKVAGLNSITSDEIDKLQGSGSQSQKLRLMPLGAKINATISMSANSCNAVLTKNLKSVPVSVNVVLALDREIVVLPLSVDSALIRVIPPQ